MKLHRPKAFAGFLMVSLLALVGFAAFSATGARTAPPADIPAMNARVAGALLGVDLGPDPEEAAVAAPAAEPSAAVATTDATTSVPPKTTSPPTTSAPRAPAPTTSSAPPAPSTPTTTLAPTTTTTTTSTTAAPTTTESPPTTTAAPTTTASPYPPGVTYGVRDVEEWRPLVEQYFPPELVEDALSVMECESQGNPLAQHPVTLATGLFQFIPNTWDWASDRAGWGGHSAFEPEANIASAAWLVTATITVEHPRGPWAHWTCQPAQGE